MSDLTDTIESAAGTPQSATQDGRSATARSIDELIKADQYLTGKAALSGSGKSPWGCVGGTRAVLPDSVGPRS